jgi:cation transport ATPase
MDPTNGQVAHDHETFARLLVLVLANILAALFIVILFICDAGAITGSAPVAMAAIVVSGSCIIALANSAGFRPRE